MRRLSRLNRLTENGPTLRGPKPRFFAPCANSQFRFYASDPPPYERERRDETLIPKVVSPASTSRLQSIASDPPSYESERRDETLTLEDASPASTSQFPSDASDPPPEEIEWRDETLMPEVASPASTWDGLEWVTQIQSKIAKERIVEMFPEVKPRPQLESRAEIESAFNDALFDLNTPGSMDAETYAARVTTREREESEKDSATTPKTSNAKGGSRGIPGSEIWKDISIKKSEEKLSLYNSLINRTGMLVPDPALAKAKTLSELLHVYVSTRKPTKLTERLKLNKTLVGLPNVKVIPRRVGLIDRERKIGRWKVIEQELADRGLPRYGKNAW